MIITSYYQAIKEISFESDSKKHQLLNSFSEALAQYGDDPAAGYDAAITSLNHFYFALPTDENTPMDTSDMAAIAKVNQEVLENEMNNLFAANNIEQGWAVKFEIDKFGRLMAREHPQSREINAALAARPEIANRMLSALQDMRVVAHQARLDMWEQEYNQPYTSATKKALMHEKSRFVMPDAEFTMVNGQLSTSVENTGLREWLSIQHSLLAEIIAQKEAEQLALLGLRVG